MRILFLLIVILISYIQATAQYQNRYWHFGNNVCLDFINGEPVYVQGSALVSNEGCATQCDANGDILFYTNGETVYNKLNQVMDNGDSIGGHNSSAQSVVIVPDPGNPNEYYLFTTDADEYQFQNGLCWSKIDMSLNNGLGKITTKKNLLINNGIREGLCAIKRSDCLGYWVITYREPKEYITFSIDINGINAPNYYSIGLENDNPLYQFGNLLQISNNGTLLVRSFSYSSKIEVLLFDINYGTLTNPTIINLQNSFSLRGICFNKNNQLWLTTNYPNRVYLFEFNIVADTLEIIKRDSASIFIVPSQLAMGNNGKIYIAQYGKYHLSALQYEDSIFNNCTIDTAVVLDTKCRGGLPNEVVIPSPQYYPPQASFTADVLKICPDSCIAFKNTSCDAYEFEWFFEGAEPSYSTDINPQNICYPNSGTFGVMLVAHHGGYSDTAYMSGLIQVYAPPQFEIVQSDDSLYCNNTLPGDTYQWYYDSNIIGNATNPYYTATQNGNYSLQVTNGHGCTEVKTITVTISTSPYVRNICNIIVYYNKDGFLQIRNTGKQAVQYHITDINGRSLYAGMIPYDDFVRTQIVQKGICLLHIICGEIKQVMKLVTF